MHIFLQERNIYLIYIYIYISVPLRKAKEGLLSSCGYSSSKEKQLPFDLT